MSSGERFCNSCGAPVAAPRAGAAEDLRRRCAASAQAALERHGGSVEKFIGGAVVGLFDGVPLFKALHRVRLTPHANSTKTPRRAVRVRTSSSVEHEDRTRPFGK